MSYYDNTAKWEAKGVDYDLLAALEYNEQEGWTEQDIDRVLAVVEGARDEESWCWFIRLNSGAYVLLEGSCDYTGWD
jgi:hypothetical protein